MALEFVSDVHAYVPWIRVAQKQTALISYGRHSTDEQVAQWGDSLDQALRDGKSYIEVLRFGDIPIGYYWFEKRHGEVAYLIDFYVDPGQRRRGYGTLLFRRVVSRARRAACQSLRFVVSHRNATGAAFFSAQGAREAGVPSAADLFVEYVLALD